MNMAEPICRDWSITFLFYSAVHLVGAYFASKGTHFHLHKHRDSAIGKESAIAAIYFDYRDLKNFSELARYERQVGYFTEVDVHDQQDTLNRIKVALGPLL